MLRATQPAMPVSMTVPVEKAPSDGLWPRPLESYHDDLPSADRSLSAERR
jgi:hypothetical protein